MDTRKDDSELIHKYISTKDPVLREEIILRYIPLVHFVLGRLGISQTAGQDYEDAASQGIIGLIEALDHYDINHGTQFSTYATLRIRGKVIDQLRSHDWLSRGARQRARQVQGAIDSLWEKYQRPPSDQEITEYLQLDEDTYRKALIDSNHTIVSLDTLVYADGSETLSLHEFISDDENNNPDQNFEEEELKYILIQAIQSLPKREQLVLSLYYYEKLTFKEIGAVLDVSESRVCQLHTKAVMMLKSRISRELLKAEKFNDYSDEKQTQSIIRKSAPQQVGGLEV
ncbi:MAG: sigma-70 family RNA polymerase sigma factor [Anaerolineales bacterium]